MNEKKITFRMAKEKDSDCCAGVTVESHNNALEAMKMCQIQIR